LSIVYFKIDTMFYKTLFLNFAIIFTVTLNAQTEKGTFTIGAEFKLRDLNISKKGDFKYLQYNAGIEAGYFFKNNWLIGGEFNFYHTSNRNSSDLGFTAESYSAGIFSRKFFNLKNPKWKPFAEIGLGYNNYSLQQKTTFPNELPSGTSSGSYGKAVVGISYFATKNISLNLSGYKQWNTSDGSYTTSGGLKFGANFYINAKK